LQEVYYSFDLSTDEVFWLSGMFGLLRFPFIEMRSRAHYDSVSIQRGQSRLQERGWIRYQTSTGWEIDPLPAALMRWITDAEVCLSLLVRHRNESAKRCDIYCFDKVGLLVTFEPEYFHFQISLRDSDLTIFLIKSIPNLAMAESSELRSYSVTQPEEMVHAAWNSAEALHKAIRHQGYQENEVYLVSEWLKNLTWFAHLTYQKTANRSVVSKHFFVCGNNKTNWWAQQDSAAEKYSLVCTSGKTIDEWLENILEN
jgi:hypothetical protein